MKINRALPVEQQVMALASGEVCEKLLLDRKKSPEFFPISNNFLMINQRSSLTEIENVYKNTQLTLDGGNL